MVIVVMLMVGVLSFWVLEDARARTERHRPVVATIAGVTIVRPEAWATLCLLAVVLFLPMYLVARRSD